jgi:hypothetical protein
VLSKSRLPPAKNATESTATAMQAAATTTMCFFKKVSNFIKSTLISKLAFIKA